MKWSLIIFLLLLAACQGNGGSGTSDPRVSSGGVTSAQAANAYIQEAQSQIPPSLQLKRDDLESLKPDGLVTQEEALELAQIIKD